MASRSMYLRRDLPDGFSDRLLHLAGDLDEGATHLHADSQSRDQADRYHAALDGERLMRKVAKLLRTMARQERIPG